MPTFDATGPEIKKCAPELLVTPQWQHSMDSKAGHFLRGDDFGELGVLDDSALCLPWGVISIDACKVLDSAQPVGRMACTCWAVNRALRGMDGHLPVGFFRTIRLQSVIEGLPRIRLSALEELRIDLSAESRDKLSRKEIEQALRTLSTCLAGASQLRVLAVKLAAWDMSMDRLRLSQESWEELVRGLCALARHQQLQA